MKAYTSEIRKRAIKLRKEGKTTKEIGTELNINVPKSTYTGWFAGIVLNSEQKKRISDLNAKRLDEARIKAVQVNRKKRVDYLNALNKINFPISKRVNNVETAKIALAMLCLGEATKYGNGSVFSLGNTNHKIITLYIDLLRRCFKIDESKFRCTVMCRADQNISDLEKYWRKITGISKKQFYKARVDVRSVGKPTKKVGYKGVLKVDYIDTRIQLELESLADLLYNQVLQN